MRKEQIGDAVLYLADCLDVLPTLNDLEIAVLAEDIVEALRVGFPKMEICCCWPLSNIVKSSFVRSETGLPSLS